MLHENLRLKRKERGLSQEELASRLHVVRQTISKWEKGMSVPDSEQLIKIAVILETTVSELLVTKVENEEEPDRLAKELSRINTQLAIKNHRMRHRPVGKRTVPHQHAAWNQKPSDAACAENHRCCSARVCSFDFCNYGVELCANVAIEIHKEGCCPFASKQDRCNFSEHFL